GGAHLPVHRPVGLVHARRAELDEPAGVVGTQEVPRGAQHVRADHLPAVAGRGGPGRAGPCVRPHPPREAPQRGLELLALHRDEVPDRARDVGQVGRPQALRGEARREHVASVHGRHAHRTAPGPAAAAAAAAHDATRSSATTSVPVTATRTPPSTGATESSVTPSGRSSGTRRSDSAPAIPDGRSSTETVPRPVRTATTSTASSAGPETRGVTSTVISAPNRSNPSESTSAEEVTATSRPDCSATTSCSDSAAMTPDAVPDAMRYGSEVPTPSASTLRSEIA